MEGTPIDSEKRENVITSDPSFSSSNHCIVVLEHEGLRLTDPLPRWRVSVTITLPTPTGGEFSFYLPAIEIGPLSTQREAVAIAHYPDRVIRWRFGFESSHGRTRATAWLLPGSSTQQACGLFRIPFAP